MRNSRRWLALLIVIVMCLQAFPMVSADNVEGITYSATINTPEINVSEEEQTVVLTVKADQEITLDGFGAMITTPDGFAVTSIVNTTLGFTAGNYSKELDEIGYYTNDAENTTTTVLAEITYTIPANTPAGEYTLGLYELEISKDYGEMWESEGVVSATLTITDPNASSGYTWSKVDLADIAATDTIAITMTKGDATWALYNANGTSKAPTAVVVDVNGNVMTSEDKDTLAWNIANDNGTLTIYVADSTSKWLYSTDTNNGTRVGTNADNKAWVVDETSGYLKNVATSRYLGVYTTNPDWRAYTNYTNYTANQTLSFWKLVEGEIVCNHANGTSVEAKTSTCTEKGNIAHFFCADCGKYFADSTCAKELAKSEVELALADHDYSGSDSRICVNCGIYKDGSTLTVEEVLAYGKTLASGTTTDYKYYVTGVITEVYGTTYGNMYIQTAEDGDELTIYGLYQDGTRYDSMTTKPVAGDTIKVYGPIQNYNGTIEIVNAELIEHTVPECEHEDQTGDGNHDCDDCGYPDVSDHDYSGTDSRICVECGWYKEDSTLTIAEALAFMDDVDNTGSDKYYVTGVITEIKSTTYGNMYIEDAEGNTLYLYGLYSADGSTRYDAMETKPAVGDTITVYGVFDLYYTTYEMVSAWMTAHTVPHTCTLNPVEGQDATCIQNGFQDAYYCSGCGNYYEDAECAVLIGDFSAYYDWCWNVNGGYIPVDSTNHNNTLSPYCVSFDKTQHYIYCGDCNEQIDTEDHDFSDDRLCDCGLHLYTVTFICTANGEEKEVYTEDVVEGYSLAKIPTAYTDVPGNYEDGKYAYMFDGWDNSAIYDPIQSDLTVYTKYVVDYAITYTITWNVDGEYYDTEALAYGSAITAPAAPTKDGYTFTGWTGDTIPETMPAENITINLTAQWKCTHEEAYHTRTTSYSDITDDTHTVTEKCDCGETVSTTSGVDHDYTSGISDYTCACGAKYTGWDGKCYIKDAVKLYGWNEIDGAWYYLDPDTGVRAEGLTRVPYKTGDSANADDLAYYNAHQATSQYTDANSAVYVFGVDGKLDTTATGIVNDDGTIRYAVDGVIAWHVGLVEVDGEYYYFMGDVNGGGNIMATGKVYATRNTTDLEIVSGGIYTFGADGKLGLYDGITNIDGTLYYYDNYRLAIDAGLIQIDGNYYYVRSNGDKAGQLVVNRSYWVADTNGLLAAGMYSFDADGKIVIYAEEEGLEGIVEIDGKYYYYIGGVRQVGAGVVELTDDSGETFYIYVRSNGELATGIYWPTTRNGLLESGAYDWGTDGKYYPTEG